MHDIDSSHSSLPVRHSTRLRNQPAYLKIYECSLPPSLQHTGSQVVVAETANYKSHYPISNYVSTNKLCPEYACFTAAISQIDEPKTYKEAVKHKYKEWQDAMQAELTALEKNNTWLLTCLPI